MSAQNSTQTAYLAGGCFWGMQELIRQIPGVLKTEVGYCGGSAADAYYERVKQGDTGHAEVIRVCFDPRRLSYRHLLFEFFRLHNPSTRHRQGNDIGSQYRSVIFHTDEEQRRIAQEVIQTANQSGDWQAEIVTEVVPFQAFFPAESYHQDYLQKHPGGYTCHYVRRLTLGEQ